MVCNTLVKTCKILKINIEKQDSNERDNKKKKNPFISVPNYQSTAQDLEFQIFKICKIPSA